MKAKQYLDNIYRAMRANGYNLRELYAGKSGALRLAREIGFGFNDSLREGESLKSIKSAAQDSYSMLCIRFYQLKPPVDAKDWIKTMLSQVQEVSP